jgi:uncharacterized protein YbjT (DUF2867 family)
VLAEGPGRHAGKNHYLSTDVLSGTEIAGALNRATDRPIRALMMTFTTSQLVSPLARWVMPERYLLDPGLRGNLPTL